MKCRYVRTDFDGPLGIHGLRWLEFRYIVRRWSLFILTLTAVRFYARFKCTVFDCLFVLKMSNLTVVFGAKNGELYRYSSRFSSLCGSWLRNVRRAKASRFRSHWGVSATCTARLVR